MNDYNIKNTVVVHYHRRQGNYFDLSLWKWLDNEWGQDASFSRYDSFGAVAVLDFESLHYLSHVYVMVKNKDWTYKTIDYRVNKIDGVPKTEVWIVDGDETLYYSRQAAVASAFYGRHKHRAYDMAINSKAFDKKWGFDGWLGTKYQPDETQFRLWAPTAEKVEVILYRSTAEDASVDRVIPMVRGDHYDPDNHQENTHGVWELSLSGDLNYYAYCYRVYYRKRTFADTRDPYARAVTANGRRSIIINPELMSPKGFSVKHGSDAHWRLENPNQAVITEMHIRDFTKSATSGVREENRGKYLGAIETGTTNRFGDKTGFDYLRDLGTSYIQLQPVFDHHQTFDANGDYAYNWGYDPENYNVPEASFCSNPHEPLSRIYELKALIQAYHDAGIGVIMDVVYNHTYSNVDSALQLTVPDYYYRMNPDGTFQNGTGVGNETASEKEMFRKYMLDSLRYWIEEYNIDGFRFDLMGIHDVATMNAIRQMVDSIDPRILLYGEGWDMGLGLMPEDKAKKDNAHQMPGIGFFNDNQRDAVKGAEVYGTLTQGFVSGAATEDIVAKTILGSDELVDYLAPNQVVNYVEAHDNYNLNDLLWTLNPKDTPQMHIRRVELANTLNLLSQGMCFMQLGQEFLRTKRVATGEGGTLTSKDLHYAMNSYNAPDTVNQIDWDLVTYHKETIAFVRKLIALKTKDFGFSWDNFNDIRQHVYVESAIPGSGYMSFIIDGDRKYRIILNASDKKLKISMTKDENYDILFSNVKRLQPQDLELESLGVLIFEIH